MPRLARLRLISIGHPNARFRDVTLDLRDAGGRATDSTIWLRNGGGKSTLISLLFALVRPDQREFLGTKADAKRRRLHDYVLPQDRSVVAAEWELDGESRDPADAPARLITGVFYEWRGGASADDGNLRRLYFAGRASAEAGLGVDSLPLYLDGNGTGVTRKRNLSAFLDEWNDLRGRHPHLQLSATTTLREWSDVLEHAGLDPDLFLYQLRMNQREGGADEIFRFADHEAFVDFLLELAFNPDRAETVSKNIARYREELRRRKEEYLPECELVDGIADRMRPMADVATRRTALKEEAKKASGRLKALSAHVRTRRAALRAEAARNLAEVDAARRRADEARLAARAARARAAQLRYYAAEDNRRRAELDLDGMRSRHRQLDIDASVWEATIPLREQRRHEQEARHYRGELARRRTDFAPLLDELRAAARRYAAALAHRAEELRNGERDQRNERARWLREQVQAEAEAARCGAQAAGAEQRLADVLARLRDADRERARLEDRGTLRPAEDTQTATGRLASAAADLRARLAALEGDRVRIAAEAEKVEERIRASERDRASAGAALETAMRVRDEAEARRRTIETDPVLLEELEVQAADLERLPDTAIERLDESARRHVDAVVRLKLERAVGDRALRHLETKGLLPPSADVEQILEVLRARLPAAWSGWEYLSRNLPEGERAARVDRLPEIVSGVMVRESDLEKAREILLGAGVRTDLPVIVAPQGALESERRVPGFVVGPSSAALYDRAAAETERARRRERAEELGREIARAEERRAQVETLVGRLRAFRAQHPRGWFSEQAARVEDARRILGEADMRRTDALVQAAALKQARVEIDRGLGEANGALRVAERHGAELEAYQRQHEDARAALADERESLDPKIVQLREDEQVQRRRAGESADRASAAEEAARGLAESAIAVEHQRRSVHHVDGAIAAEAGPISDLHDAYSRLAVLYDKEVGADWLAHAAEQAEKKEAIEREKLRKLLQGDVSESKAATALDTLAQPDEAERRWREAVQAAASALGQVGNGTQVLQRRAEEAGKAEAACTALGVPRDPEDPKPSGPAHAEMEASLADAEVVRAEGEADSEETRAAQAEAARQRCEHLAETLDRDTRRLETLDHHYAGIVAFASGAVGAGADGDSGEGDGDAPPEDAAIGEAVTSLEGTFRALHGRSGELDDARGRAAADLRTFVSEERFDALRSVIARKFRSIDEAPLEEHARYLLDDLELRARTLSDSIAEIDRHRDLLVAESLAVAQEGLALLHAAERQSRLPEHVPGLGGGQFLRIITHEPDDPTERRARIGELVDEMAERGEVLTGIQLVQRGVRRLCRPVRVRVMNPDPTLGREAVDIPDMARFSGGEQLTSAILLYCTLAQLRARHRGLGRSPSSILVLDNPIGRASRARFLELQREVARAMGVQLIYTTGVNDFEALHILPNVIRLRNERVDRNTGQQLVEPEAEVTAARVGRDERAQPLPEGTT